MNKTTLYIGLNDKDTKVQKIDTIEAFKIASNVVCANANGGTIYNATGIYKHDNGQIIIENTLRIELIEAEETAIHTIITTLKSVFNQESIIRQNETIDSYFC